MLTEEIKKQAVLWERPEPEDWELIGMRNDKWNYYRYYQTPNGDVYYTVQKKGKQFTYKYEVRENPDRTLTAKRIIPKKRRAAGW